MINKAINDLRKRLKFSTRAFQRVLDILCILRELGSRA